MFRHSLPAPLAAGLALAVLTAVAPPVPAQPANTGDGKMPAVKVATDLYGDPLPAGALQRLGTVRFRHDCTALAYSPDGKVLASGGRDNVIRLYDAASGKELRRLVGHQPRTFAPANDGKSPLDVLINAAGEGGVNSVAFSPDGKMLASGGWDDTVRLWDVETGKELRKIAAHKAMVGRVAFSPDGRVLASRGAFDGSVRLWDPVTGTALHTFVGLSNINPWRLNHDTALAFSPDSKTLAATARNALVFFDVATGGEVKRLPAHVYGITVAYSPDGTLLASGGVDAGQDVYSLRLWDAASGKELRKCELPKNEPPTYLAWDPNNTGKLAAVVAEDDMHIFDAQTGKEVVRLKHYWPSRVVYSRDGKTLASAGNGPTIRHWDAATGKELHLEYQGHQAAVAAVAISDDGKTIASGGDQLRLWDPATGKLQRTIEVKGGVTCLAFAPDGKTVAAGGRDRVVHVWEVATGNVVQELKGHKHAVCGLAYSRDGKRLASGDVQASVRVWDIMEGKQIQQIDSKTSAELLGLAFAADDRTLFCAGAWNDTSFLPKPGTTIKVNGKDMKFDGNLVIQGIEMSRKEGYYALEWDVATGKEVRKLAGLKDTMRTLAVAPDGKLVAAASRDGRICLWDAATGQDRLYIVAHPGHKDAAFNPSPCLAFAPDGKTLASASTDRTIRLWDVTTAKEKGQLRVPDCAFRALAFARDGKTLVTGGADTEVLIWDVGAAANALPDPKGKVITIQQP
jgi:WD40 repeat protein